MQTVFSEFMRCGCLQDRERLMKKSNDCRNVVLLKHDSAQSVNIKISLFFFLFLRSLVIYRRAELNHQSFTELTVFAP